MAETIRVDHLEGDRFEIAVRGHSFTVDQPVEDGGADTAPTPTELFVASLASCVAFYACRYLSRHELVTEGLSVSADYSMATRPTCVGEVILRIELPPGVPEGKRDALLAVVSHCTVHNTLEKAPSVSIELGVPAPTAG